MDQSEALPDDVFVDYIIGVDLMVLRGVSHRHLSNYRRTRLKSVEAEKIGKRMVTRMYY